MAEYDFGVLEIESSLKEQSIFIKFSLDLDQDTVTYDNIYLMAFDKKNNANRGVKYRIIVEEDVLQLKLEEWAVPNCKYTILIQPGITSVTNVTLEYAIIRNFIFKSDVTSTINILSPATFSKISDKTFTCTWEEIGDKIESNYYLEIDKSNSFNLDPLTTIVKNKESFTTNILEDGQYYLRIRATDKNNYNYGYWSDIITFTIEKPKEDIKPDIPTNPDENQDIKPEKPENDDLIVIEDDLKIMSVSENGITPESFDFMFEDDIDISEIEISITRRDL